MLFATVRAGRNFQDAISRAEAGVTEVRNFRHATPFNASNGNAKHYALNYSDITLFEIVIGTCLSSASGRI